MTATSAELRSDELSSLQQAPSESVVEPSSFWRIRRALSSLDSRRLTRKDVPLQDLRGKWVIISGSNSGIGREAALFFAQCGANIILACRNPPPHEENPAVVVTECKVANQAAGHEDAVIEWWETDMTKLSTVNAFATRWLETGRPLDILCNNAGIGGNPGDGKGEILKTEDGFEIVHQVNFLSHCLLTLRLLQSLAKAVEPRVVFTTSCNMFFGTFDLNKFNGEGCSGEDFYCNNKLFLQVWLTELQLRLSASEHYRHIMVNGVHPGCTNTNMWHIEREPGWVNWMRYLSESLLVKTLVGLFGISAEQGSYAIIHAATIAWSGSRINAQQAKDNAGCQGGKYFNRIWETEPMPYCHDPGSRLLVWKKVLEELDFVWKDSLDTF